VLPHDAHQRLAPRLTTPGPYLVAGAVRLVQGDVHVVVDDLSPFHERP
jgi:hypothetical protein